jgi:hypothetical protein
LITQLEGRTAGGEAAPAIDLTGLETALTGASTLQANRQAADLREVFSGTGNRFSSTLANSEAILRGDIATNTATTIQQLLAQEEARRLAQAESARQFDVSALGNAIGGLTQLSQAAQNPLLSVLGLGVLPPEVIAQPGLLNTLIGAGATAGAGFLGGR